MGCDIHLVLERKTEDYGWVGLHDFVGVTVDHSDKVKELAAKEQVYISSYAGWRVRNRNYALFGALAGVRHDGPEPRGVPEDASPLAKVILDGWNADGHSHTWYMLDEALPIFAAHVCPERLLEQGREFISNELFDVDHGELANYRLIIFFDN